MVKGKIIKVSGPLVVAEGLPGVKMYEVMRVGSPGLIGEVIELKENRVSIQVYEETAGLGPGEPVVSTGGPLSVELAPGLVSSIYDGIQRPLDKIREKAGNYIARGVHIPGIDRKKRWKFKPLVKKGDKVISGDIIGEVQETTLIIHKIMVPPEVEGEVVEILKGEFNVEETIARVRPPRSRSTVSLSMLQTWPVRRERPCREKLPPAIPLYTGTRVIDTFFPITMGGTACIPGPFGSGKTVVLHQIAKWADADVIIYVGCGERGNEMCDVLMEMPKLKDPRTGEPLMKRTVLIANTSNMPVAAREASVYTGATIGEYFRDMGYKVAIMADSTSRWAEAMREMSGRLEEMPGEEGYPAYLAARVAEFYERSGRVVCQGQHQREGSLSIIGAVSPPGGDLSDPVVQATLRMVKVFWSLEDRLAYQRHFPAINWLNSYSLYLDNIEEYLSKEVAKDYLKLRSQAMRILQQEASLEELVRLVGLEALSPEDRLILETAKSIREDFLHQHAFDPQDTYTGVKKQYRMLRIIIKLFHLSQKLLQEGVEFSELAKLKVKERISRMKFIDEKEEEKFDLIEEEMEKEIKR
ncbi:V-type ATP synthase subunit A [bacterium]|nr:V-type ATP synthase subunit A [bacterium]NIN91528.1 V-type ATP synthase subunit A [bacterium]NIO17933.1 V-type ATP synthase subunit A [bacterium]NIO72914.1 V-type ATP synthase subunit A [bacterium]